MPPKYAFVLFFQFFSFILFMHDSQGFCQLIHFVHFLADIDECAENTCSQICVNSPGSFTCYCDGKKGFRLSKDMRTCEVKYNYYDFYFSWCQETAKHLLPSISALCLIYWSIHNFLSPYIKSNLLLLLRFIFFFSSKISKQHPLIISPHQDNSSFVK